MIKPNILIITNEVNLGDSVGQINGFELLSLKGEIGDIAITSHASKDEMNFLKVKNFMKDSKYDILLIWSPSNFPNSENEFHELMSINKGRQIVYWEGDAWGLQNSIGLHRKKSPTKQMSWWASASDFLFTTAGFPQSQQFIKLGAKNIFHIINTYCHIQFNREESTPPMASFEYQISMMARNLARVPLLSGLPGSSKRFWLVKEIRKIENIDFRLFGSNWPSNWSFGLLPYYLLSSEIRKSRFNVNWDHFDSYHDYTSDRLPVAMISGRPSFSTLHPGMRWLRDKSLGLFLFESPEKLLVNLIQHLDDDPNLTHKAGLAGHYWAKNRISHREAARYIMSKVSDVNAPPSDPWSLLGTPLSRFAPK